jgi:hypothetical protein
LIATAIALLLAAHFACSGILQRLTIRNSENSTNRSAPPHLETARRCTLRTRRNTGRYLFRHGSAAPRASRRGDSGELAYAIQLVLIAGGFPDVRHAETVTAGSGEDNWPLVVAWLAVIWLNFSPLYTILALKAWRHGNCSSSRLVCMRICVAGDDGRLAIASASLIKVLPAVFIYYWLITDRRTFAYACVMLVALLIASHLLYGPEMAVVLCRVVAGAAGDSYGLNWHENISLKAAIAKLFGYLPAPTRDGALTSGYFLVLTGWRKTAATVLGTRRSSRPSLASRGRGCAGKGLEPGDHALGSGRCWRFSC